MSSPKGQSIDLASLSTQQLSQVKKQLDDELEHLTNSFQQLRAAQAKFRECLRSIAAGLSAKTQGTLPHMENTPSARNAETAKKSNGLMARATQRSNVSGRKEGKGQNMGLSGIASADRLTDLGADKPILVPLTTSLYVPGTLADTENVIVDVGTGFYVEKSTKDATKFYESKVDELGNNLKDLEAIVGQKSNNLRVVEDVLRQKVLSSGAESSAQAA